MTRLGVGAALVAGEWVAGDVDVVDGRIAAVGLGRGDGGVPAGAVVAPGAPGGPELVAVPGFVDLQINGFAGVDFRAANLDGYAAALAALASTGTTAVQPTFYSTTVDRYAAALGVLAAVRSAPPAGARALPAHLEGPFLSRTWAGAHDLRMLIPPSAEVVDLLLAAGPVGHVTLAPELDGAREAVERLVDAGIRVSMGHTDATAAEAADSVDRGVRAITHCFNAHRRFQPRDPGPAGVALTRPEVVVGLICDLVHLAPDTVRLAFAAAPGRVAVVTDAVAPAGTDAARWDLDGAAVTVAAGEARLADGTLAGSVVTMDRSLRNLVSIGIDPAVAVTALSTVPAAFAGLGRHDLAVGTVADVAVLDRDWVPRATLVGGVPVYGGS